MWEGPSRHESSDDEESDFITEEAHINAMGSMPHYSVVGGRQRREERIHQQNLQGQFEESINEEVEHNHMEEEVHMEDMIGDFYEDRESPMRTGANNEDEETILDDTAKMALYEGCQYSLLCTCLELLNLQTIYGWSNASVTSLFK